MTVLPTVSFVRADPEHGGMTAYAVWTTGGHYHGQSARARRSYQHERGMLCLDIDPLALRQALTLVKASCGADGRRDLSQLASALLHRGTEAPA